MIKNRSITIISLLLLGICMIMSSCLVYAAGVPKAEKEIPLYTGAVRDMNRESEVKEMMGFGSDRSLRSAVLKVYNTAGSAEDVFGFYLQMIGGIEGSPDIDPMQMKPGAVSQVWYEVEYYDDEDFDDATYDSDYGESKHLGKWRKETLSKNRKPYKQGKWIKDVRFEWLKMEANNDLTSFYLNIFDNSFDREPNKYIPSTEIEVRVSTSKSEQAMREEEDEEMEEEIGDLSSSLKSKPPTESELGAPIYPGARFDAESSAGMSAGNDYAMYIYLTNDLPQKVAAFYEQKLKIKPVPSEGSRYMIPLKGKMPIPDEGIVIEPNTMFGGSAKTVITIQKMVKTEE
jgi:hypothetical protein